jgi:hypothetical protein
MKVKTNEADNDINEAATRRVKFIFETNNSMHDTIGERLNEKNFHIALDEFPYIREIIFHSYHPYFLFNIDRQQYLSRMLSRRDDQTTDYFITWFICFLCESNPDWMNYQDLLSQWTECFIQNSDLFSKIIKKFDILIELWTKVAPDNQQRSTFFVTHMVTQCFRQGMNINLNMTNSRKYNL